MSIDRELIGNALLAQITSAYSFARFGRRFFTYSAGGPYPSLFQRDGDEDTLRPQQGPRGLLPVQIFTYEVWVYAPQVGADTPPASSLNPLVSAVELALEPGPRGEVITLGGLVQHAWIEGKTIKDTGEYSKQPTAMIPVSVKVIANSQNRWTAPA